MEKPLRIGFCGPAGSGKTTQAQLLRARYKGDILSFATPLKKTTKDLFGERMDEAAFARMANQQVGVLCRHLAGPGFWVEKLLVKVSPNRNCFVDDVRFMNEFHSLKRLGFLIIKLSADTGELRARRPEMTDAEWQHESELGWVSIRPDLYINTGLYGAEETQRRILEALPGLLAEPVTP